MRSVHIVLTEVVFLLPVIEVNRLSSFVHEAASQLLRAAFRHLDVRFQHFDCFAGNLQSRLNPRTCFRIFVFKQQLNLHQNMLITVSNY